jgi:hypothetical protein
MPQNGDSTGVSSWQDKPQLLQGTGEEDIVGAPTVDQNLRETHLLDDGA